VLATMSFYLLDTVFLEVTLIDIINNRNFVDHKNVLTLMV